MGMQTLPIATLKPDNPRGDAAITKKLRELDSHFPHDFTADEFRRRILELRGEQAARSRRLWDYYHNPLTPDLDVPGRPYRQAQEWGLPPRITGFFAGEDTTQSSPSDQTRKDVAIENDIGWRIDTIVDFLFGRPVLIDSLAPSPERAAMLSALLRAIIATNGGLAFFQKLALVGSVSGGADVLVKFDTEAAQTLDDGSDAAICSTTSLGGVGLDGFDDGNAELLHKLLRLAQLIRLEIVEPSQALPILHPHRAGDACVVGHVYEVAGGDEMASAGPMAWLTRLFPQVAPARPIVVDLLGKSRWQRWKLLPQSQQLMLLAEGDLELGRVPAVHLQNIVRPFDHVGGSEVEPLLPLQDLLNERLSDRARRIVMQSSKIYLGVGITDFADQPVEPGRMWATDNVEARVQEFGGDTHSPAEDAAIGEIREAMDKQSGVSPIAAGAIRDRLGNLTSAAALRITFQSLLSRTERKRVNYGTAIEQICDLALAWLNQFGHVKTSVAERRVRLTWPDPIPTDAADELAQAKQKQALGVDPELVLRELGYAPKDTEEPDDSEHASSKNQVAAT